jgi:flagellar protein FlgJ
MANDYTYEDKLNFIAELYCPARVIADQTGCSWELILGQAAGETGWGKSVLPGSNNVFNIKADPSWKGEKKVYHVWEKVNGKTVWVDDPFRIYGSYKESLEDRMLFLLQNKRYAGLRKAGIKGDYKKEAQELQDASYATDPLYAKKLIEIIEGPSMRRAVARAQKRGCGPLLPVVDVTLLDGARVPIAVAKMQVLQDGKQVETATDARGHLVVRITPNSGDIQLKVFDKDKNVWSTLDPIKLDKPAVGKSATLIAPTFTAQTSTREHEKRTPPKPAAPPPTAAPAAAGHYKEYKVRSGDSLASIARDNGTSYKAIADANGIKSPYIIRPDQILRLPDVKAQATAQQKRHAASPAAAYGSPAANDHDGGRGGISTVTLGQKLRDGGAELHTVFFRNENKHPQTDLMHSARAPWMKFAQEEFEKGVKRRAGRKQNDARILEYFKATTLNKSAASVDETPYCAAFVNWCLGRTGYKGNGSALAASFAKWGRSTRDNKPALGAVALIKFPGGGNHVTFVAGISPNGRLIATLGGNQGADHEVSHSRCPKTMVVAYRYPADYPDYDDDYVLHDVESDHAPMTANSTH